MYYCAVRMNLGCDKYVYTKLFKSSEKEKIKYFNSNRNDSLIILDYWSKNIEEYFHLRSPKNINLSENLQHIM